LYGWMDVWMELRENRAGWARYLGRLMTSNLGGNYKPDIVHWKKYSDKYHSMI